MPFDIYDQAVLTALVNEPVDTALETAPMLGQQIAPLNNIQSRYGLRTPYCSRTEM